MLHICALIVHNNYYVKPASSNISFKIVTNVLWTKIRRICYSICTAAFISSATWQHWVVGAIRCNNLKAFSSRYFEFHRTRTQPMKLSNKLNTQQPRINSYCCLLKVFLFLTTVKFCVHMEQDLWERSLSNTLIGSSSSFWPHSDW